MSGMLRLLHNNDKILEQILQKFPRINLGIWPTPLQPLRRTQVLGAKSLWLKRDDLTGFTIGGSKARSLEFLIGNALSQKKEVIVTGGMANSNHLRDTVVASAMFDFESIVVIGNEKILGTCRNRDLFENFNVRVKTINGNYAELHQKVQSEYESCLDNGIASYLIPAGGLSTIATLGFIRAAKEITIQMIEDKIHADTLFIAHGGGVAQAGLLMGFKLLNSNMQVIGVSAGSPVDECKERVRKLITQLTFISNIDVVIQDEDILIEGMFANTTEGVVTEEVLRKVKDVLTTEGILLDPLYTARAFLGMQRQLVQHAASGVIFWHTGGVREPILGSVNRR